MVYVTNYHLYLATKLLRSRLIQPRAIGAQVLDYIDPQISKIDDHLGRWIGYFSKRANNTPMFVLFGRLDISEPFSHCFVYILRSRCTDVPSKELARIERFCPRSILSAMNIGLIRIEPKASAVCDFSVLINSIVLSLDPILIDNFKKLQIYKVGRGSNFICFNKNIDFPNCDVPAHLSDLHDDLNHFNYIGSKVCFCNNAYDILAAPLDSQVIMLLHLDHLVYCIISQPTKTITILLPHVSQFRSEEELEYFQTPLIERFRIRTFVASRYYGRFDTCCYSQELIKACVVILCMSPHAMVTVHKEYCLEVTQQDYESSVAGRRNVESMSYGSMSFDQDDANLHATDAAIDIDVSDPLDYPESLPPSERMCSQDSSQATIVMPDQIMDDYYNQEIHKFFANQLKFRFPIPCQFLPAHDPTGTHLANSERWYRFLYEITSVWGLLKQISLSDPITLEMLNRIDTIEPMEGRRFIIFPIVDKDLVAVVIIDLIQNEWIYINPKCESGEDECYRNIRDKVVEVAGEGTFKGWILRQSFQFHRDYVKIHILLCVFKICKLFYLACKLPQKISYTEQDFREYCFMLGLHLQIANRKYNFDNGLVDERGNLVDGAFVAKIVHLSYERVVIRSDECPFCGKRLKALPQHIRMAHGSGSALALDHRYNPESYEKK